MQLKLHEANKDYLNDGRNLDMVAKTKHGFDKRRRTEFDAVGDSSVRRSNFILGAGCTEKSSNDSVAYGHEVNSRHTLGSQQTPIRSVLEDGPCLDPMKKSVIQNVSAFEGDGN